jgi:hypothetical protein
MGQLLDQLQGYYQQAKALFSTQDFVTEAWQVARDVEKEANLPIPVYHMAHGFRILLKVDAGVFKRLKYEDLNHSFPVPRLYVSEAIDALSVIQGDASLKGSWNEGMAILAAVCMRDVSVFSSSVNIKEFGQRLPLDATLDDHIKAGGGDAYFLATAPRDQKPQLKLKHVVLSAVKYTQGLVDETALTRCFRGENYTASDDGSKNLIRGVEKEARLLFRIARAFHEKDPNATPDELFTALGNKLKADPTNLRMGMYERSLRVASGWPEDFPAEPGIIRVRNHIDRILES